MFSFDVLGGVMMFTGVLFYCISSLSLWVMRSPAQKMHGATVTLGNLLIWIGVAMKYPSLIFESLAVVLFFLHLIPIGGMILLRSLYGRGSMHKKDNIDTSVKKNV